MLINSLHWSLSRINWRKKSQLIVEQCQWRSKVKYWTLLIEEGTLEVVELKLECSLVLKCIRDNSGRTTSLLWLSNLKMKWFRNAKKSPLSFFARFLSKKFALISEKWSPKLGITLSIGKKKGWRVDFNFLKLPIWFKTKWRLKSIRS